MFRMKNSGVQCNTASIIQAKQAHPKVLKVLWWVNLLYFLFLDGCCRFALFVLDNRNLQELFHPDVQKKLKIDRGIVFFHFNRKLCYNKIGEFVHDVGLRMADLNNSVSTQNNGDQATCSMEKLILNVTRTSASNAILRWNNFVHGDQRQLLRYVVSIRES